MINKNVLSKLNQKNTIFNVLSIKFKKKPLFDNLHINRLQKNAIK